jgi:hypothetical protein
MEEPQDSIHSSLLSFIAIIVGEIAVLREEGPVYKLLLTSIKRQKRREKEESVSKRKRQDERGYYRMMTRDIKKLKLNSVGRSHERRPLVGEVSANLCG